VLRILDSVQLTSRHTVATPVNWKPGEDVIVAPAVSSDEARQKWMDLTLTGDLSKDKIPGAGAATITKCKENGVTSTFSLLGKYLEGFGQGTSREESAEIFKKWLSDIQTPAPHRSVVVDAVFSKLFQGFNIPAVPLRKSAISDQTLLKKLDAVWTGQLCEDLWGVGTQGQTALNGAGIQTTWQLAGHFLQVYDYKNAQSSVTAFEDWLKKLGVSPSHVAGVVQVLVGRIIAGLNIGKSDFTPKKSGSSLKPPR